MFSGEDILSIGPADDPSYYFCDSPGSPVIDLTLPISSATIQQSGK